MARGKKAVRRKIAAQTWQVVNQQDGNDTFEVTGDTYQVAASEALKQLGWALVAPDREGG